MCGCIQPMSSPMMKRMLGFCCCCAKAGTAAATKTAEAANKPSRIFLAVLMVYFLPVRSDCLKRASSLCPGKVTPYSLSVDLFECSESRRGLSKYRSARHGALQDDSGGNNSGHKGASRP